MDNVMVSVIMANYNTPLEYLKEAIDSILTQTYKNFELIIIDDASTDGSLDYIKSLDDNRIVIIENDKNCGQPITRNKGLAAAKGKYIAIMDSDDISLPDRLEVEVRFMESHPEIFVCGAWFEKFGIINEVRKPIIEDHETYRCQLLFYNTPRTICHSSSMIRKSFLDDFGIKYDESLLKAQDYGLWAECSKYGKMAIIDRVLIRYRTHPSQISISGEGQQADCAALVSRRQLQSLGIDFEEGETRWRFDKVKDKEDCILFYNWLQKIKLLNEEKKIYDSLVMDRYLVSKLSNGVKRMKRKEQLKILFGNHKQLRRTIARLVKNSLRKRLCIKNHL